MSLRYLSLIVPLLLLAGCARFGPATPEATPAPTVVAVPTFTPTAAAVNAATETLVQSQDEATAEETTPQPSADETDVADAAETTAGEDKSALSNLLPTVTPANQANDGEPSGDTEDDTENDSVASVGEDEPRLVVGGEIVNVRQGPGVEYPTVDAVAAGETFTLTGRNEAGDWWQVCCFGEEPGWLYGPLVEVQAGESVALAADIPPPPPTVTPAPVAVEESAPDEPAQADAGATPSPAEEPAPVANNESAYSATAGSFDPAAQYHVVGYRVIGYGENNGGIFNNGGQHIIFVNVIDADGNGISGAVVKNAINDNINIVTGPKGPGRAEFEMFWDPYKLYVASDPSGPVTSQITNQMNTAYPHVPDIVGRLGPVEDELAICPTVDERCDPPFFHAHWSYEVTFQKVQ